MRIGQLETRNSRDLISLDTRLCALVAAPGKVGKTTLAAELDAFCRQTRGKPALFIAVEAAEGGGTMSVAGLGIEYVMPKNWQEADALLTALATDTHFGGVVLDNATDYNARIVKPYALGLPNVKEAANAVTRREGVPARSDYQVMGECMRGHLNRLVNLTNENTPPTCRKDLLVTALEKEKTDDQGVLKAIQPDLPGAMASTAVAMFQSVLSLKIVRRPMPDPASAGKTLSVALRMLHVKGDGMRQTEDRMGMWEHERLLTGPAGQIPCLLPMWEAWLARRAQAAA